MPIDLTLIEDEDLRTELQTLGISIPHASSVLNVDIGNFDAQMYYKLLAMEAFTYDHSTQLNATLNPAGVPEYQPFWQSYSTALMSYIQHAPVSRAEMKDYIISFYCFLSAHFIKGYGSESTYTASNAKTIFNMDGHAGTVSGLALNYFDDFVAGDPLLVPPTVDTAAHLTAIAGVVSLAWDLDKTQMVDLIPVYIDVASDQNLDGIFDNLPEDKTVVTTADMWDKVYMESNWKWFIELFQVPVNVPPRPE